MFSSVTRSQLPAGGFLPCCSTQHRSDTPQLQLQPSTIAQHSLFASGQSGVRKAELEREIAAPHPTNAINSLLCFHLSSSAPKTRTGLLLIAVTTQAAATQTHPSTEQDLFLYCCSLQVVLIAEDSPGIHSSLPPLPHQCNSLIPPHHPATALKTALTTQKAFPGFSSSSSQMMGI